MVNDPSGLIDPDVAGVCADSGAALVVTHTRARPKEKLHRPHYDDVVDDVKRFLGERLEIARAAGVPDDRLLVCPGPDLGKDPAQTIELLPRLEEIEALGLPVLLAVSRKDFVGALTRGGPRERLGGSLAAVAHGLDHGAQLLRVHDVAATRDFLTVRAALRGEVPVPADLLLADDLRREEVKEEGPRRRRRRAADGEPRAKKPVMTALRIAHISDLHCGSPHFQADLLERAIEEINELQPGSP